MPVDGQSRAKALFSLLGQPMCHNVDAGEIEQRLDEEGRPIVPSVESLVGQQPRDCILNDVPDFSETGAMCVFAPPDERLHALFATERAIETAVVAGIGEELCNRCTDSLRKFHQMWQQYGVIAVCFRGNSPKGRAVSQGDNVVFCAWFAAVRGVWTNQVSTVLGSHSATVDHDRDRVGRGGGTRPQGPNESALDLAQRSVCRPTSKPSAQGGTADEAIGSGQRPPPNPFMGKVTQRPHHLHYLRPWVSSTAPLRVNLIDQGSDEVNRRNVHDVYLG